MTPYQLQKCHFLSSGVQQSFPKSIYKTSYKVSQKNTKPRKTFYHFLQSMHEIEFPWKFKSIEYLKGINLVIILRKRKEIDLSRYIKFISIYIKSITKLISQGLSSISFVLSDFSDLLENNNQRDYIIFYLMEVYNNKDQVASFWSRFYFVFIVVLFLQFFKT